MASVELPAVVCQCGCGESFVPRRREKARFIKGHNSRLLRKEVVKSLTRPRRLALYVAANNKCENCGLSMVDQIKLFKRRLEIHHLNHDHSDNRAGNHRVLCTVCHNEHSLAVRDESKKSATYRRRLAAGEIHIWSKGKTKETDEQVARMARSRIGIAPWNKGIRTGKGQRESR